MKTLIKKRLGRTLTTTNQYEEALLADVVLPGGAGEVTFDGIGGMENIKGNLQELIIWPLRRPDLYSTSNLLQPVKGVLLYGPPGTGKTMLAKAIANESGAAFINVRVSSLQSKWFGDAQKLVTAVFTLAWKLAPAIIFVDEVDSFLGKRRTGEHEAVTNMKTEFMTLWDGEWRSDARVLYAGAAGGAGVGPCCASPTSNVAARAAARR
jgi:SpoVK/Ycf46/Vps4 family AAA+-type ATPase